LAWQELDDTLRQVVAGELSVDDLLKRRRKPLSPQPQLARKPVRVMISNTESDFYTLVDVVADDRSGLLYDVTRCIGLLDFEIYISKAATIKDQVTDTFYLKDRDGNKIRDTDALEQLRRALLESASPGQADDDARIDET
jgi:[protein-PII] uridylyltransferase